jgi:hypothetical protein
VDVIRYEKEIKHQQLRINRLEKVVEELRAARQKAVSKAKKPAQKPTLLGRIKRFLKGVKRRLG